MSMLKGTITASWTSSHHPANVDPNLLTYMHPRHSLTSISRFLEAIILLESNIIVEYPWSTSDESALGQVMDWVEFRNTSSSGLMVGEFTYQDR